MTTATPDHVINKDITDEIDKQKGNDKQKIQRTRNNC